LPRSTAYDSLAVAWIILKEKTWPITFARRRRRPSVGSRSHYAESVPGLLLFVLWTFVASVVLFRKAWGEQALAHMVRWRRLEDPG
jgi:hypothetical protein